MKSASIVNRLLIGALGVLFVVGLALSMLGGTPHDLEDSVGSSEKGGRRAAFLLLDELGFDVSAWRQAPFSLPQGEDLLWMAECPQSLEAASQAESEAAEDSEDLPSPSRRAKETDPRHPLNYAEFVRRGGTLLLPNTLANLAWLREECELDVPDWEACDTSARALELEFDTGERMVVALESDAVPSSAESDPPLDWDGAAHERLGWHDLAIADDGRPFASWLQVAHGRLVLIADDDFLNNDTIGAADNGMFLARLAEALERGGQVLFDEFALGLWLPQSKGELLLTPGVLEVTYHWFALLLVFVLLHAWSREFPRDPEAPRLNPRLRVTSQARLFERAGRYDLLAHELRLGTLRRLIQLSGLSRRGRGLHEGTTPEELQALARDVGRQIVGADSEAAWQLAFDAAATSNATELEDLGGRLNELERTAAERERPMNTASAARG